MQVVLNKRSNCLKLSNGLLDTCEKAKLSGQSLAGIHAKKGFRGRSLDHGNSAAGPSQILDIPTEPTSFQQHLRHLRRSGFIVHTDYVEYLRENWTVLNGPAVV